MTAEQQKILLLNDYSFILRTCRERSQRLNAQKQAIKLKLGVLREEIGHSIKELEKALSV
jgi:hypothetical protein